MSSAPQGPGVPAGGRPARGYASPQFSFGEEVVHRGSVAAVVLAAGRGSRFGGDEPKTLARVGLRTLLGHAVASATTAGLRPLLVVVGYRADDVARAAGTLAEIIVNPDWEQGLSTSLRAALASLTLDPAVSAVTVALGDQPRIGSEAYRRLVAAHRSGAELAVATYDGRRGHPVLIGRRYWTEAMELTGDEGARSLLAAHPAVEVACDETGSPVDVDTPADLERLVP